MGPGAPDKILKTDVCAYAILGILLCWCERLKFNVGCTLDSNRFYAIFSEIQDSAVIENVDLGFFLIFRSLYLPDFHRQGQSYFIVVHWLFDDKEIYELNDLEWMAILY